MAKKHLTVVRVVIPYEDGPVGIDAQCAPLTNLLECLRYGGLIYEHEICESGVLFDVLPHANVGTTEQSRAWANALAGKMQSHGFNAVAAPRWEE